MIRKLRAVAVAGAPCSGSSTIGRVTAELLGWGYVSFGTLFRSKCAEAGLRLPNASIDLHRDLNIEVLETVQQADEMVFDGCFLGPLTSAVGGIFRVLVEAPIEARSERCLRRDSQVNLDAAIAEIKVREAADRAAAQALFGSEDYLHPRYFQLTLENAAGKPPEDGARAIIAATGII